LQQRMHPTDLFRLQDLVDSMLVSGELETEMYKALWADILAYAGYTELEFEQLIDDRWDCLDRIDVGVLINPPVLS